MVWRDILYTPYEKPTTNIGTYMYAFLNIKENLATVSSIRIAHTYYLHHLLAETLIFHMVTSHDNVIRCYILACKPDRYIRKPLVHIIADT